MLDMIMPEKDGIDVLNEVLLTGIPVKVVLTSGFSDSTCAWLRVWQNSTTIRTFPFCASRSAGTNWSNYCAASPRTEPRPHHAASSSARTSAGPSILRGLVCTQRSCIDSSAI